MKEKPREIDFAGLFSKGDKRVGKKLKKDGKFFKKGIDK